MVIVSLGGRAEAILPKEEQIPGEVYRPGAVIRAYLLTVGKKGQRVRLVLSRTHGNFVRELIHTNRIDACHDISDGGLLVALAEMCMPKNIGASITFPDHIPAHAFAFGEDQARYIIACKAEHADEIVEQAAAKNIPITTLGKTEGDMLEVSGLLNVAVSAIKTINAAWMPKYMA